MLEEEFIVHFEPVTRFKDAGLPLPVRKTAKAAGYDFVVAEPITIPPYHINWDNIVKQTMEQGDCSEDFDKYHMTLAQLGDITKASKAKPTLVSTGMKAYLDEGKYLELSVRSSCPLKYWLVLANGVGIIDGDYVDNPDNEGEIFFQLINLSPFPIDLFPGDIIGQGIIKDYYTTDNDSASAVRTGGFGSTNA